jgi:hypothetical protein
MNSYSHQLYHNEHAREQQASAEQYRLANQSKKNNRPAYKGLIAHVGGTLIRIGTTMQDLSEFELDAEYTKTTEES